MQRVVGSIFAHGRSQGGARRPCPPLPKLILDKNKDLGNYDKHLPLRDCLLAGVVTSGLTKEKCNTTMLFALASEGSGVTSVVQNESPLAYYFYCATHCLNLSASAAVKVSAIQKLKKNVARKVVKMFKISSAEVRYRRKQRC